MKRLMNFKKIQDFLERAQSQDFQASSPIYMNKEHSKLLMEKAQKFKLDFLRSHGMGETSPSGGGGLNFSFNESDKGHPLRRQDSQLSKTSRQSPPYSKGTTG